MTSRSVAERRRDVRHLLGAARNLVNNRAKLLPELVRTTGLSPQGVELALTRHLELDASDEELTALVNGAGQAEVIQVVLSANVFVDALRALAIARAASDDVRVSPSSREPAFARALVEAAADPALTLATSPPSSLERGEIHVYGRDETIAAVRASARAAVLVRGHGAGMGVACVLASDALEDAARLLAEDVAAFDQRGCLSPRVALVEGDEPRARAFAEYVHHALNAREAVIPRGFLSEDERAEALRYADSVAFAGALWRGDAHAVGLASSVVVPPVGRHLHVVAAATLAEMRALLAPIASAVVTVGISASSRAGQLGVPHARISPLGKMQRPPLDGPVDLRET
ncbi:MAG: acyl-CoA reductase [Polyangiaceae bacterium]